MEDEPRGLTLFLHERTLVDQLGFETGATTAQLKDLQSILTNYLRQNKIQASWVNRKAIVPVIERCIRDGLQSVVGRSDIEPQDDLTAAFNAGFAKRRDKLDIATRKVKSAYTEGLKESHLALNEDLVRSAQVELQTAVSRVELLNVDRVVEKGGVREAVLTDLINVAREKAEELIPGSKEVKLSVGKETGLVRNMLFSYMTTGEVNPLIEIQDILSSRGAFQAVCKDFTTWVEFCHSFGVNYHDSNEYIADLVRQMQDAINQVPLEIRSVGSLDIAYKALGNLFAIDNPFNILERLSDNPKDERSIWDESHSRKIEVEGQVYRIPQPQVLALYASMIQTEYPQKSNIISKIRVPALKKVIEELGKPDEEDEAIKEIDESIANIKARSVQVGEVRQIAELPDVVLMNEVRIGKYRARQSEYMDREMEFFPLLGNFIDEEREIMVEILQRHINGEVARLAEIPTLFRIQAAPVFAQAIMKGFHALIAGRIKAAEVVFAYANPDEERNVKVGYSDLNKYFDDAKRATIITLLEQRSQKWIEDADTKRKKDRYRDENRETALNDAIFYRTIMQPISAVYSMINFLEKDRGTRATFLINRAERSDSEGGLARRDKKIARYTTEPYAATEVILLALARAIPAEFWPPHSLDFDSFLKDKPLQSGSVSLWSSQGSNNPLEKNRITNLREVYMEALSSLGFSFSREQIVKVLPALSVREMSRYALITSNFFGLEKAFRDWSEGLLETLDIQVVSRPKVLAERFVNFNPQYQDRLDALQERRQRTLAQVRSNKVKQIAQLQTLGLALPEDYFSLTEP